MTWLDRTLWPALVLLAVTLAVFQCTDADLVIQDGLYHFETGRWLLPRDSRWLEFIFHKLPNYLIFVLVAVLSLRVFAGERWRVLQFLPKPPGRGLAVLVLTLALTPSLVSLGKVVTRSHCPWSVRRYGGPEPYVKPLSRNDECCPPTRRGACWPAGHASGGFALVALASLVATRRGQVLGLLTGLLAGAVTGGYQMMKGAHYTSDTLVTMLLAWTIHLLFRRALPGAGKQSCYTDNTSVKMPSR
jgi:membrane-associated PAP2 superfamily phosphatase